MPKRTAVKPILLALVLCDQIIADKDSNKRTLVGLFNSIYAGTFPCRHPSMSVYLAITDGRGKMPCTLRVVRLNDNVEIIALRGSLDFPSPTTVAEISFTIQQAPFTEPGRYAIEFLVDGTLVGLRDLDICQAPKARTRNENGV